MATAIFAILLAVAFPVFSAPDSASGLIASAQRQFDSGNYTLAIATLQSAVAGAPSNAGAYYWLGRCYYELRDYDNAVAQLEKAVSLDGQNSVYHQWLGRAYGVLGERDKAADAYEHAASLKPDDAAILVAEGEALLPDHRPQTAVPERVVTLMKRAETLDPKQPAALWYLGLAAAQQRRFEEATGYWQRLSTALPADSDQHKAVMAALEAIKGK